MKYGIVVLPGSNCDLDTRYAINSIGNNCSSEFIWYEQKELNKDIDCIIIPGGFSYGDYLRAGSIARFAPIMKAIIEFTKNGGLLLGICNGFQILLELGLLPGAMIRNKNTRFICKHAFIKTINNNTPFTNKLKESEIIKLPIAHMDGNYFCEENTYKELEENKQIIFKYSNQNGRIDEKTNVNGSIASIAGISNKTKNIIGLMPHPERACESILGTTDGIKIFQSIQNSKKTLVIV